MDKFRKEFHPPTRILMGPGPANVHPRVLTAMAAPLLGHLDPDFLSVMDDVCEMLRKVFQTDNKVTLPISGTGTAGMEASLCNVLEPGDTVLVAVNGYFSSRMAEVASRCGAEVIQVDFPWGKAISADILEKELKQHTKIKAVALVHAETSTGVLTPLPELSRLVHEYDALFIVDAVTSLGGTEFAMDDWAIDVCYSGTQKCLGAPPGLAPLSASENAMQIIERRTHKVQSFYMDLITLRTYWQERSVYHHTAPISMIYACREALRLLLEEGLEERWKRHSRIAGALRAGLETLGLQLFAAPDCQLNQLTAVYVPEEVEESTLRQQLLSEYNIEIGGGLGSLAGRGWRIGLMGESCRETNVLRLISALEQLLPAHGFKIPTGQGIAATERALADS